MDNFKEARQLLSGQDFSTSKLVSISVLLQVSKSFPDLSIPTSSFPNKFFREGQTKNPTFSSPPVDILVILVRTERQRRLPSTENRFKIGLRNVFVENAVFSIDIEPRVILLVYWEASTTC